MKLFLSFLLLLLPLCVFSQNPSKPADTKPVAETKPAPETPKLVNPVKPTPTSIAAGKKVYASDCAMCHGKEGEGKGDLAVDMHLTLRDYRDSASLKDLTDGEIYSTIANGKGQMTGEAGRMKPAQIWDVVNYIRSLSQK